jgi:hypothetical protein
MFRTRLWTQLNVVETSREGAIDLQAAFGRLLRREALVPREGCKARIPRFDVSVR